MNESNLEGSDPLKKSTMETIDCPLRITFYKIWRKRMKDNIPEFLQEKLKKERPKVVNFPDDMKSFIVQYGEFYNFGYGDDVTKIFKLMRQGVSMIPECELNGCRNRKMIDMCKATLSRGCCQQHSREIVMLERYGVNNLFKNPDVAINGMLNKYDVSTNMHLEKIKNKIKTTLTKKYGVENPSQIKEIKEKKKQTLLANFGVEHNSMIETVKKQKIKKSLEKYGVEHVLQSAEVRAKGKQTILKKYGVEHHLQDPKIYAKTKKTNLEKYGHEFPVMLSDTFRIKEFKWKTGEISLVQGYEPIVLKELEDKGYTYEEVITGPNRVPTIPYVFEGEEHLYFPDIFIPKENLIIEVKSDYTLNIKYEKNQAKFSAVKSHGFDFKLEVR